MPSFLTVKSGSEGRERRLSSAAVDLLPVAIVTVAAGVLSILIEANEKYTAATRRWEGWEFDELIVAFVVLALGLSWYTWRRRTEAICEIAERKRAQEELSQLQARLAYLLSSSPAVIYTAQCAGDYALTFVSENVLEQLGYAAQEFLIEPKFWASHIHPEDAPGVFAELPQLFEKDHHIHEYRFLHKDGSYRWMRDELKLVRDAGGTPKEIIGLWIDITDRKQLEEELATSKERLAILFEYAPDAYYLNDMTGTFVDGNKAAEEVTGYKREELIGKNFLELKLLPPEEIPKAAALLTKNAQGEPTGPDEFALRRKDGSRVLLEIRTFPVTIDEQSLVLGIARDVSERKRAEEALQQAHDELENRVAERTEELLTTYALLHQEIAERKRAEEAQQQAHSNTVLLVAATAEAHDQTTGLHLQSVRALTEMLARQLGYSAEDTSTIGLASVLHDIGKVRVPNSILASSSKLTEKEWELMKQHTTWGAQFLAERPGLELAATIAHCHHERWDGSGYPNSLAANAIPEAATIVTVADAFDAMTHDRPYRARWPIDRAVQEIVAYSGRQFNPKVVVALERLHQSGALALLPEPASDQQIAA